MEDNESRKWLYDKLTKEGLNVGKDYAEFDSLMQNNADSRKWVFEKAGQLGYNVGRDFNEFERLINPLHKAKGNSVQKSSADIPDTFTAEELGIEPQQMQPRDTAIVQHPSPQPKDSVSDTVAVQQQPVQTSEQPTPQEEPVDGPLLHQLHSVDPFTLESKPQVKFNQETGKLETIYTGIDGRSYGSEEVATKANRYLANAHQHYWEATTDEGRKHAEDRLKSEEERRQQTFDQSVGSFKRFWAEHDADNAAEKAWEDAEKNTAKANEATAEAVYGGSPSLLGGREMHRVNSGRFQGQKRVNYLKAHDLDKLFDDAWNNLGKKKQQEAVDYCFHLLVNRYPNAKIEDLDEAAAEMARQQSDQRMYNLAVEKNMPKDNLEYLMRKIAKGNSILQLSEGLARSTAGTTGDMVAAEMADQTFEQQGGWKSKAAGIGGTVLGFAADPLTALTAGAGSTAAKGTAWVGGKILAGKAATSAAVEAATRKFTSTTAGKILTGMSAGAGNFGAYEFSKEGLNQWQWGGHINSETGENEGYSLGEMGKAGGHGATMGAATGWIAPVGGKLSDRLAKATKSTAGKVGVRAGQFGATVLTEGTIFSIPEWTEGKRDAFDVWTDNQAMMLGFKGQHLLKTGASVLGDAFSKEGRVGFETKFRKHLDGRPELSLTKDEKDELEKHGYGDLNALVKDKELVDEMNAKRPSVQSHSKEMSKEGEIRSDEEYVSHLQDMLHDNKVSEAARAKMYYLATGRMLPMSTVISCGAERDGDDYVVKSYGVNGVITSRRHRTQKGAEAELERINRQMELNYVSTGERYTDRNAFESVAEAALDDVAKLYPEYADKNELYRQYMIFREIKAEERSEAEQLLVDRMEAAMKDHKDETKSGLMRMQLKEVYGVDVDKALAKEPNRRSKDEQEALEEYIKALYPEGSFDEKAENKSDDFEAQAGNPEQPVDPDAPISEGVRLLDHGADPVQPEPTPYKRGFDAAPQDRRDIVLDMQQRGDEESQEAYQGLLDRINKEADEDEEQYRIEKNKQVSDDGNIYPAFLKPLGNEEPKPVYIIKGHVQMLPDGTMIDEANSSESIGVYNPATQKNEIISPRDLKSIGIPISAVGIEADVAEHRDAFFNKSLDEVNGKLSLQPGETVNTVSDDGSIVPGQIIANDGQGNCVIGCQDGTQQNVSAEDLQRVADEIALADYKERNGIVDTPLQPETSAEGGKVVPGAPSEYTPGMEIVIREDDNSEKRAIVQRRVRLENAQFIPDEYGNIIEYYVEGDEDFHHSNVENMDDMVVSYTTSEPAVREEEIPEGEPLMSAGPVVTPPAAPSVNANEESAVDAMPMTADGDPDYYSSTPSRARQYIYDEADLSSDKANEHVQMQIEEANQALAKAKNAAEPKMGTSIRKYKEAEAKRQHKIDEAQKAVDFWSQVKAEQDEIMRPQREAEAAEAAAAHEAAVKEESARREAEKAAAAERAAVGNENPMPAITEKWNSAAKADGMQDDIVLPNGEHLKGHYVLHEAGAVSPSHQANNGFQKTEGFPMDESGNTVNDRDYERDSEAQTVTRGIADNYDQRALQSPVVVSQDGVVLSGNGRTMAGDMAAQNGTDSAYNQYLTEHAGKFGFTSEQVGQMQHPRVAFVPDEAMPYNAETFAKFNQQDMKSQSKTEHAVKLGKTVADETFAKIVNGINKFDTIGDFYNDANAGVEAVRELIAAGNIPQTQYAQMVDGDKLSAVGREMLENVLVGKSFEGNPDAVRMMTEVPSMRQSVTNALSEVSNNLALGDDFTLKDVLTEAIKLCYDARTQGKMQFGEPVSMFARQTDMFASPEEQQTVADYRNATVMMLADMLNEKRVSQLKKVLATYNNMATDSANGQMDLFSGEVKDREQILNEVSNLLNYGTEKGNTAAQRTEVERRKESAAEGVPQAGNVGQGNEGKSVESKSGEEEKARIESKAPSHVNKDGYVSNEAGEAIVLYHGTENPDIKRASQLEAGHKRVDGEKARFNGDGISFSPEMSVAQDYAGAKGNVIEAKVKFKKPYINYGVLNMDEKQAASYVNDLKKQGYDGILNYASPKMREMGAMPNEVIVFDNGNVEDVEDKQQGNHEDFKLVSNSLKDSENLSLEDGSTVHVKEVDGANKSAVVTFTDKNGNSENKEMSLHEASELIKNGTKVEKEPESPRVAEDALFLDKPETWVGRTFFTNGMRLKCTSVDNGYATFDNQSIMMGMGFDVSKVQEYLRNGEWAAIKDDGKIASSETGKEQSITPRTEGYSIEARKDTRDDSDIYAVKFDERVSKDEFKGQKAIAKNFGGYWSNFGKRGFIFKTEEDAQDFAETVLGRTVEEVEDEKPIVIGEISPKTAKEVNEETKAKEKEQHQESAEEDKSDEKSENHEESDSHKEDDPYHTAEERAHYEELKKRMRAKLNQLSAGIDPELLEIGVEMAFFHFKGGMRRFSDFCKRMIEDCGDKIRPHLKMLYNAAAGTEDFIERGWDMEMDDRKAVRDFDVYNFDKKAKDVMGTAAHVVAETESQRQGEQIVEQAKTNRNETKRNERKQKEADTAAVASQAETVASQAEHTAGKAILDAAIAEDEVGYIAQLVKGNQDFELTVDNPDSKAVDTVLRKIIQHVVRVGRNTNRELYKKFNSDPDFREHFTNEVLERISGKVQVPKPNEKLAEAEKEVNEQLEKVDQQLSSLDYNDVLRAANTYVLKDGRSIHPLMLVESGEQIGAARFSKPRIERITAIYNGKMTDFLPEQIDIEATLKLNSVQPEAAAEPSGIPHPSGWEDLKVGDKVIYKGEECTVHDFEDYGEGRPSLDTGMAPVIYELVDWEDIQHIPSKNSPKEAKETTKAGKQSGEKPGTKAETKEKQLNLFADLFNQNEEKHGKEEVHLQSGTSTAEREGRHEPRPDEPLGKSQQHEAEGTDRAGMAGRNREHSVSDTKRSGSVSELHPGNQRIEELPEHPKNSRNNVSERGKDYAPKGETARIEANIKAIETMNSLVESGKPATRKDMEIMRKFSGWGGLGGAFKERNGSGPWAPVNPINKKLHEILTPEQYEWARGNASMSQYFTPAFVIDTMWDVARALGFKGGNTLEGSAGIGNIIGLMPRDLSAKSDIQAVEVDEAIGQMLTLLYPDAKVNISGFEKVKIPNGSVDLSITNVPFVTGLSVFDDSGDSDLSKKFRDIHNFCIAKNVRKLREGGIGVFISSSGTLDGSPKLINWITNEGNSDFVGAFRLNSNTFGGTNATSDIIVVRKRINGKASANAIDLSKTGVMRVAHYVPSDGSDEKDLALTVNQYFIDHPEYMGGEMKFAFENGETWQETSRRLFPSKDKNQEQMLTNWLNDMRSKDWKATEQPSETRKDTSVVYESLGEDVKEGSMLLDKEGNLCIAQFGKAVPLDLNKNKVKGKTKAECYTDYKAIKDALAAVLEYQTSHEDDKGLSPLLRQLNDTYDNFVKTYGHLNKNVSISFLKHDMDYPTIAALEGVTESGKKDGTREISYAKTDIFNHRVVEKETEPEPTNVKDGIIASLYLNGRVDVPYIAGKLGKSETEVRKEIVKSGLGFENPLSTEIEVSYEYLSGNVREKLSQAKNANTDGQYDVNIKALEKVIPMDIPAHLIEFSLGSSWVDPKLYTDYIQDKTDLKVSIANAGGTWIMDKPYYVETEKNKALGVTSTICEKTIYGHELIEAALQNKTINVTKRIKYPDGETETLVDKEASTACANKIDEIRQDFKDWARKKMQTDPLLSQKIERTYNEQFNNYVPKEISDEFVPEHFGGAAKVVNGKAFKLRPHQAKAAIRATTQPLMLAHEVGTGKTYTLITTAMEMRRLGTARKPMIVVQNATVGQFVSSAKALYPNARILTLEDTDKTKDGRKNFYAKIRYNDWDMIVVPQSVFERIPDSPEREAKFIRNKIEEKMMVLEQLQLASKGGRDFSVKRTEKEIEDLMTQLNDINLKVSEKDNLKKQQQEAKAKQNAAVKAQEMLDRDTDDTMDFDDMGIDALLVDEAHEYKHLGFETAMQRGVKGVDPSYSKKSQGVYLKTQAVLENNNGRNVVFATGTPISNTAAEIWTFMRYLMPEDVMRDYGIYYFDDFVRNFGQIQQTPEFGANGKYKEVNRFLGYVNLPELVRIWSSVTDTVLTKEAGGVNDKIPEIEGGKAQDVYLPQTKALRRVMLFVKAKLNEYENMSGQEKKKNSHIPLVMYGIAKAAAVDARLVLNDAVDEPNSKTNETVRQTLKSLEDSKKYNGTIAIFADNYQNRNSGFNLYEDVRQKLIAKGVPADQIVIMKSGMSVKKKLEIFDKVNRGEIRVIMGSTYTLGTGVNIQERLHTEIHVDAPTRPMDYIQRLGRALRQGNLLKEWGIPVRIIRFGVEDSLDVTAYQRLKTKGAIVDSIMDGKHLIAENMNNRVLEEEEDMFGDITAQLSGSQYALLKNQMEKEVKKLESRKAQYEQDQTYINNQKPRLKAEITREEQRKDLSKAALQKVESMPNKEITVGTHHFKDVDAMADFIKDFNSKQHKIQEKIRTGYDDKAKSSITVNVGGLDFVIESDTEKVINRNGAGMSTSASTHMHYSCDELGIKSVPVERQLLKNALTDIIDNVVSGKDFKEYIESADRVIERDREGIKQLEAREGKPFEDADKLEKAYEKLEEYEELMKKELAEKEAKYAEMDKSVDAAENIEKVEEEDENSYREVSEKELLSSLREASENGQTVKVYRTMQVIDGELYSPMAKKVAGKETSPIKFRWEEAEEHPELAKQGDGSKSMPNKDSFYIVIDKGQGKGSLTVAYNPYTHTSRTVLNDQFTSAFVRPNLVVVEVEVPRSELDHIYHAEKAKDSVGEMSWHSGAVSGLLAEMGNPRKVILTRYDKPVRILTKKEEAEMIAKVLEGTDIAMPYNLVTPQVRAELEKLGVEISDKASGQVPSHPDFGKAEYVTDEQIEAMNRKLQENAISDPKNVRAAAETLGQELHTAITIVEDVNSITHSNPAKQRSMRHSKGWYNKRTGEVVVVVPNNLDVEDAASTVFHEVVAHKGLRELVGEKNYDDFLFEVYNHCKKDVKKKIDEKAAKHGWDFGKATDEYLGDLADKGFEDFTPGERSLWQKLKDLVMKAIDKFLETLHLPKSIKLGDNELRYMLWRSYNRLKAGKEDIIQKAQDITKREDLKVGNDVNVEDAAYRQAKDKKIMPDIGQQSEKTTSATAISSITGAKILKNLDESIKRYENLDGTHNSRKLIGDLANCLEIHQEDKSSKYGTFETMNGKTLSLRLSNHNATVSNFDMNGENEGLSIVISRSGNKGITNDGDAHVIEFFYAAKDLERSEDKPLVEIIKSIKQALYSGDYVDKTGLATREEVNDDVLFREGEPEETPTEKPKRPKKENETEDIWNDPSLGIYERISAAAARLSSNHAEDKTLKNDAVNAIGKNLTDLRKAMSLQKKFDQDTVKRVGDLARVLMQYGYLSNLNQNEVKRLLAAVKNSVGHEDVDASIQKVMDIMVENQLKNAEATLHQLLTIKASKVDAKGVEVQGQLDPQGQTIMKVMKKATGMPSTDLQESMAEAMSRMGSEDHSVAEEAALEYAGLNFALEYVQNITESKAEEKRLRDELKQTRKETNERDRNSDSYKEYVAMVGEAIRQNKIDRAAAYYELFGKLTDSLRESVANAVAFKDAEKARIHEIHHNANSDMFGRPADEHRKDNWRQKFMNNSFVSFVFAPLATFDQMLRMFGSHSANGEGYLWNRYMRGWIDAREYELTGVKQKYSELDNKVHEIFGRKAKNMGEVIRLEHHLPKMEVNFWNGGEKKSHELTQGNLMYIYMVNKMLDGRMKLRKMGISEEDVEAIEANLDPRYKDLADWIQNDFLVDTRNEYNETHKRMFGASMAAIENYFPLKILANARADKAEELDNPYQGEGISTSTGSIIKRRRNALALDITGADALNVVLEHVAQMEHWNAYAEWNRDLNILRTYKHFRNQVQNMSSIYGGGKELWKLFNDLCQMAAGSYRPQRSKLDDAAVNFAKGVTAAKVSFRIFTALKQLLSAPAYIPEARADFLAKDLVMPATAWNWCMKNLPIFRERVESRTIGDPRLLKSDMDWKLWRNRVVQIASRIGMAPNAFIDALTVGIGTHAMYQTKRVQYLRDGYTEEDAERMAKQDATILYNQTQQSSEGVFLSPMQVDRSWLSVMFTIFRNSSMAYTRQLYDAMRNLKRNAYPANHKETIEFMTKQLVRNGLVDHVAERTAHRKFRRQMLKDTLRIVIFGYVMQLAWNLGAYLPYIIFGDDEDEKSKMWDDVWAHTMFGSIEGLTGGDVMSMAGSMMASGEGNAAHLSKEMPLTSDFIKAMQKFGTDKYAEGLSDIINLVVQSGIGVNPQSISDAVLAIIDTCGDDPELAHEAAICVMRILQVPQSQIEKIYFDEIGLSGDEVSQYTPQQLIERYAQYKVKRGRFNLPWTWEDGDTSNWEKIGKSNVKERLENLGDDEVNQSYLQYEEEIQPMRELWSSFNKAKMSGDRANSMKLANRLKSDPEGYQRYERFRKLDAVLDKLVKSYLKSNTSEEAEERKTEMLEFKKRMVQELDEGERL